MKKIGILLATIIMAMLFVVSASAATEGYYTYKVENGKAIITVVNPSISGDVTIPSTLGGYSVTSIGNSALYGCTDLTSITIPDSVTSIEMWAFGNCTSLTSITIPDSVTAIGFCAFNGCTGLTSITLPFVGENLDGTGYTEFLYIFGGSNDIPTSLKEVIITEPCKTIGPRAFASWCESITNIIIPNSVTSIGYIAFGWCTSLTSITIPDSVTSIGESAFIGCTSLTNIIIPNSVTSIGESAFAGCASLTDVYYYGAEEQWDEISIDYGNDYLIDATIHFNCCTINSDYKHSYTSEIITAPTHFTEGVEVFICDCGYTYTEVIAKLTEHTYEEVITEPTCTAQGYTTYTCECGDTYTDNFVKVLGHNMSEFAIVKDATCTEKGEERSDCSRCDYFETKNISLKQHMDTDGDENCDVCELYLPSLDCLCVCHAKTIGAFLYKLFTILDEIFHIGLLEKVFHITSAYCDCGLKH